MDVSATSITARLDTLPDDLLNLMRAAGAVGMKRQVSVYLVGGFVRDLLLGAPNLDIDLVVEGDAIKVAQAMARRFGGTVRAHGRFGTATWTLDHAQFVADSALRDLSALDFITARRETYAYPAALPQVEPSSIADDLRRRDFTINTLATGLDEVRFGELLDLHGGFNDLRAGVIRVLHDQSFVDDPTRILRAVRYEQRLGFRIEPHSESLIPAALAVIPRVSGERLCNELLLIFAEREPEKALQRLAQLGVLHAIHAELQSDGAFTRKATWLRAAFHRPGPMAYLGALLNDLPLDSALRIAHRLRLSRPHTEFIAEINRLHHAQERLTTSGLMPSEIVRLLEPSTDDALQVAAALAADEPLRARIAQYRAQWRAVKPLTDGERLKALGIAPGPLYRKILVALRAARLDGAISTQAEEEQLALRIAQTEK